MTNKALQAVALVFVVSMAGYAQRNGSVGYGHRNESLIKRFDQAIRSAMADAQTEPAAQHGPRGSYLQRWVSRGGPGSVRHSMFLTAEAARSVLNRLMVTMSVPTRKLDGVGDAAFLVAPVSRDNQQRLNFVRGRVLVAVSAPGPEQNVQRVAARLLEEVNAAMKAGELESR